MLSNIDFEDLNIGEMFNDFYIVPDYQREYVWEEENVEQLLADITESFGQNPDNAYYTGSIVVCPTEDGMELELIDGQQRLTTFFIMLSVVRHLCRQLGRDFDDGLIQDKKTNIYGEVEKVYRVVLQYEDATDCLKRIAESETFPLPEDDTTMSTKRLCRAANTIFYYLEQNFQEASELSMFYGLLINKVCFVRIATPDMAQALKIFETINKRGVNLSEMDLVKNMVFRGLESRNRSLFNELNGVWKEMTLVLEGRGRSYTEDKPLRFLRYYLMARYDTSDMADRVIPEGDVSDWICNHKESGYATDPIGFAKELLEGAKDYMRYLNADDDEDRHIWNVNKLGNGTYRYHLLLLLAASKLDADARTKLKEVIESVVYYSMISKTRSTTIERIFVRWCEPLRSIVTPDQLEDFIYEVVRPQLTAWKQGSAERFASIGYGSTAHYCVKAILYRIASYVDAQTKGNPSPKSADMKPFYELQVEHIMPKTCKPNEIPYGLDKERYDYYKGLIGNLTPLEQPRNGSVGNLTFEEKLKAYAESGCYLTRSIAALDRSGKDTAITRLNDELEEWSEWGPKAIEERQAMLYKLSEEIWTI